MPTRSDQVSNTVTRRPASAKATSSTPTRLTVMVAILAAFGAWAAVSAQAPAGGRATGAAAVTAERLVRAANEPASWLTAGGTYHEQHYSPLDQINESTVGRLGLAWYADIDTERGQ